jgi:hypothetical protein
MMDRVVLWYVRRIQGRAAVRSDEVRELQAASGRTAGRVIRVDIYELDVRQRVSPGPTQSLRSFTFRVVGGKVQPLPPGTPASAVMSTDMPTLYALLKGRWDYPRADGSVKVEDPFEAADAWRLGHLEMDGEYTMSDVFLWDREIGAKLGHELGLR